MERAKRFLEHLKFNPFIAIVVDEDADIIRIFKQKITKEGLSAIRDWLDQLENELDQ